MGTVLLSAYKTHELSYYGDAVPASVVCNGACVYYRLPGNTVLALGSMDLESVGTTCPACEA